MDPNMDMSNMSMSTPAPTLSAGQMTALFVGLGIYSVIMLVLLVLFIIVYWKIFHKAGRAGWKAIIPIYNLIVFLQIIGRPWWWLLLFLVPLVNLVVSVVVALDLGKSFGKSEVYSIILLWLLNPIGMLILAFGGDKYIGPRGQQAASPAAPAQPETPAAPPAAPPADAAPAV